MNTDGEFEGGDLDFQGQARKIDVKQTSVTLLCDTKRNIKLPKVLLTVETNVNGKGVRISITKEGGNITNPLATVLVAGGFNSDDYHVKISELTAKL